MTGIPRRMALLALLVLSAAGCESIVNPDGTTGSPEGGQPGPYWSRNDGQGTAYLSLSGTVAKACAAGEETIGTFNGSEPSMTFVIEGDRIKFPLEFRGSSLLVGVPQQGVNTNNATWYVQSSIYTCSGGSGGGGSSLGRITFYTSRADGGATTITLAGQTIGSLTNYFPSGAPDCRQTSGVVSVERAPGTYDFSARDEEGRTWNGTVTSTAGGCFLMHLR